LLFAVYDSGGIVNFLTTARYLWILRRPVPAFRGFFNTAGTRTEVVNRPQVLRHTSKLPGSDWHGPHYASGKSRSKITVIDPLTGEPIVGDEGLQEAFLR